MNTRLLTTVPLSLILVSLLPSCGFFEEEPTNGGGGTAPSFTQCTTLISSIDSAPRLVSAYPEDDTYGVNFFHIWKVTPQSDGEGYQFEGGAPVLNRVPREDWSIPPALWSAGRLGLDGLDPYLFSAEDPFIVGYLPFTPGASWQSKTGALNDGSCPESNEEIDGLPTCMGQKQLDRNAPALLETGEHYALQLSMLIPLGDGKNRVGSCFREVISY